MIYIVNGAPGCGKTTFEELCRDYVKYNAVCIYSTVHFVKEVAKFCGWNGEKTPENRKFLSDLKRLLTEWDNVPYKETVQTVNWLTNGYFQGYPDNEFIIFIDCREPEEITKLKIALGAQTILVSREQAEEQEASNESDRNVLNYNYDIRINNSGSLDDLKNEVIEFLKSENIPLED